MSENLRGDFFDSHCITSRDFARSRCIPETLED